MELELDGLTKQYRDKKAVDGFTCRLREGIYGLLGPNGSGKTTLTRMLADVLRPTSGSIRLDGEPSDRLDEAYRDLIGYLPQNFGCYKEFTAMDFLLYIASLKGLDKRMAKKRAEELMEAVGLYDDRKRKLKTYSGGMKQRVGIVQALLNDPSILILDEPTAGLDPKERVRFRNLLGNFAGGKIILLSTHIVTDVEFIGHHSADEKRPAAPSRGRSRRHGYRRWQGVDPPRGRPHRPGNRPPLLRGQYPP